MRRNSTRRVGFNERCARFHYTACLILLALLTLTFGNTAFASDLCNAVPGEYLLRLKTEMHEKGLRTISALPRAASLLRSVQVQEVKREYRSVPGLMLVRASNLDMQRVRNLEKQGEIYYLEPNCRRRLREGRRDFVSFSQTIPNDTRFVEQWGLNNLGLSGGTADMDIDAPEAWDVTTGSDSVVVGIVDSGIDYNHSDLAGNMWTNPLETPGNGVDDDGNGYVDDVYGVNVVYDNGEVLDDPYDWHGTHVAGTVGAVGNNNRGIAGVNWNVKLMAIKIFDGWLGGDVASIVEAWQYAMDMKDRGVNIPVLNNSFGEHGVPPTNAEIDMATELNQAGINLVFASGNEGASNDVDGDTTNIPVDNVISVAANDRTGGLADFSNFGPQNVHLAAPGVDILSTVPDGYYSYGDGTSFSAPAVTGVVALLAGYDITLSPSEVRERLLATTQRVSALDGKLVSPGIVNALAALNVNPNGCTPTEGVAPDRPAGDADGDGVTNVREIADGSDLNDAGSYKTHLQTPVFALWTGFLNIIPILELFNPGNTQITARVSLFRIDGSLGGQLLFNIGSLAQHDVIISDMLGFERDSYGLLRIDYCGGHLDGRVSYYRPGTNGNYDFAYSIPLSAPSYGEKSVSFNTMQPSLDPAESGNLVANWLTLVNLSQTLKSYSIDRYSLTGSVLGSLEVSIDAGARADIEAGHENPGPNNVGLLIIRPADDDAPYLANLTRFGYDALPGQPVTAFSFAFPLMSRGGTGRTMYTPLTTTVNTQNWLEVINTSGAATQAAVRFFRSDGSLIDEVNASLAAHGQQHYDVNARFGSDQVGFAEIDPSAAESVIAQSMVYMRDPATGRIKAMYGSQAREALGRSFLGSYNLFLGMYDWLKLINPTASVLNATLVVNSASGANETSVPIPARGSVDLGLHDGSVYGTSPDTYGVVEVQIPPSASLFSELLRLRMDSTTGQVDFAFPTEVRDTD